MCVDKNHFTCCCCCSLTCGTIFIGIYNANLSVGYAFGANSLGTGASEMDTLVLSVGYWVTFSFCVVLASIPMIVICKRNDPKTRKVVFWAYMIVTILRLVVAMAFILYFFAILRVHDMVID